MIQNLIRDLKTALLLGEDWAVPEVINALTALVILADGCEEHPEYRADRPNTVCGGCGRVWRAKESLVFPGALGDD